LSSFRRSLRRKSKFTLSSPIIVNVVATAELGQSVVLAQVSQLRDTIFDHKIYGGRVVYLKKPGMRGKVTIFPSGKLISVGTKSPSEAEVDLQEAADTLHNAGFIDSIKVKVRLRNIVAVLMTKPLALEDVAFETGAIYEPEQFPAAILKIGSPERTFLIFNSGKVVLPGVRSMADLDEAVKVITGLLDSID
jgi:transcription initiation factor TFIID TATA-box-binding protein